MSANDKLTSIQRLTALEEAFANVTDRIEQQFKIVADEINRLNDINVAMAKRLNAIVKAGDEGGVTSEAVSNAIVNSAAKELKAKVDMLIENNVLTLNNGKAIDEDTFIVGREIDGEGKEINPRIQFLVRSLMDDVKKKIIGKKVGDEVEDDAKTQTLIITEVYDVRQPNVATEEEAPAEVQEPAAAAGAEVMRTKTKRSKKA